MNNRFLSLIMLMGMISYSGYAFHRGFIEAKEGAAAAMAIIILLHVVCGCIMTAMYLDSTADK